MSTNNNEKCTPLGVKLHRCVSVLPNDYAILENKPKIGGKTLEGEMSLLDLGALSSRLDDYAIVEDENGEQYGEKYIIILDGASVRKMALSSVKTNGDALGDIGELNTEDVAVEGQYVSAVRQSKGKIEVIRDFLPMFTDTDTQYQLELSGHTLVLQKKSLDENVWTTVNSLTLPDDDTTYVFASGSKNGTISVNDSDIEVKGLGSAAYTNSDAYDRAGSATDVLGTPSDSEDDVTVYGAKKAIESVQEVTEQHTKNTQNPHSVTKAQVGLDSIVNAGMDNAVQEGSKNYITSGAVKTYGEAVLKDAKEYADTQIANVVGAAPETLDTLEELASALKENEDVSDALNKSISDKADKETKVAGVDLKDDITAEELRQALNIEEGANKYVHPAYTPKTSGLYKITVDASGHISEVVAVQKADITALGIPAQDTTYTAATTGKAGLMSGDDKAKLEGVAKGATANKGTITEIVMNGVSKGNEGSVDLGSVLPQDVEQYDVKAPEEVKEKYMIVLGEEGDIARVKLSELVDWMAVAVEEILTAVTQQSGTLFIDSVSATQAGDILEVE